MNPRLNGPGLISCPPTNLAVIGMEYAIYWPATANENIAPIAFAPANDNSPRRPASPTENHTVWVGACDRSLMLYSHFEKGRPPSRENAKIWREQAVNCITRGKVSKKVIASVLYAGRRTILLPIVNLNECKELYFRQIVVPRPRFWSSTHWTTIITAQTARVPFWPNELKRI